MRYRQHRSSLADSMATVVHVDGRAGLLAQLRKELEVWPSAPPVNDETIHVKPYCDHDARTGWKNVHIVTLDGYGVIGFCEGPAK